MQRLVAADEGEGVGDQHGPGGQQPQQVEVVVAAAEPVGQADASDPWLRAAPRRLPRTPRHGRRLATADAGGIARHLDPTRDAAHGTRPTSRRRPRPRGRRRRRQRARRLPRPGARGALPSARRRTPTSWSSGAPCSRVFGVLVGIAAEITRAVHASTSGTRPAPTAARGCCRCVRPARPARRRAGGGLRTAVGRPPLRRPGAAAGRPCSSPGSCSSPCTARSSGPRPGGGAGGPTPCSSALESA